MVGQNSIVSVDCKEDNLPLATFRHLSGHGVIGLQNTIPFFSNGLDDTSLDFGKLLDGFDVGEAEMITFSDVRHDTDIAIIESEPLAKNTASSGFEDCRLDRWIHEHRAGTLRTAAVTRIDPPSSDIYSIRTGHSNFLTATRNDMGYQPSGRCFSVDTRHTHDWNSTVVLLGKQHIDNGFTNGSRRTRRWFDVHPQSRSCIDLDDNTSLPLQRLRNVLSDNIHAGDIQTDDSCSLDTLPGYVGMHNISYIGCRSSSAQIRISSYQNFLSQRRDRVGRHPLLEQNT